MAHYVAAALESGYNWQRVERFFLAVMPEQSVVEGKRGGQGGGEREREGRERKQETTNNNALLVAVIDKQQN